MLLARCYSDALTHVCAYAKRVPQFLRAHTWENLERSNRIHTGFSSSALTARLIERIRLQDATFWVFPTCLLKKCVFFAIN